MSKRDKSESGALVYGGVPRANLMPPEVAIRRKEAAQRRSLLALGALVAAVTVAGVVASFLYAAAAEQRLADERRITEQLLATQLEFADVTQVRANIQAITDLRAQLGGVEVLWADVLAAYLVVFSETDTVETLTVRGDAPAQSQLGTNGPLRLPRVANVTLTIASSEAPSPWAWIRAWERLDTYADASIDSVSASEGAYQTVLTLNVNESALSGRFAIDGEAPDAEPSGEDQ